MEYECPRPLLSIIATDATDQPRAAHSPVVLFHASVFTRIARFEHPIFLKVTRSDTGGPDSEAQPAGPTLGANARAVRARAGRTDDAPLKVQLRAF